MSALSLAVTNIHLATLAFAYFAPSHITTSFYSHPCHCKHSSGIGENILGLSARIFLTTQTTIMEHCLRPSLVL
jgi:hypothetical protein